LAEETALRVIAVFRVAKVSRDSVEVEDNRSPANADPVVGSLSQVSADSRADKLSQAIEAFLAANVASAAGATLTAASAGAGVIAIAIIAEAALISGTMAHRTVPLIRRLLSQLRLRRELLQPEWLL